MTAPIEVLVATLVAGAVTIALRPWRSPGRAIDPGDDASAARWARTRRRAGGDVRRPAAAIGAALAGLTGRSIDEERAAWLGRGFLVAGAATIVSPTFGLLAAGGVTAAALGARRSARRRAETAVIDALPEVIDLFSVAVSAGLSVPRSVDAVAERAPPAIGRPLAAAAARIARGEAVADALAEVGRRLGPSVTSLTAALSGGERLGVPLGRTLSDLGRQARLDRRRRAEEAARRLPVTLLFPLVCCTLPAFALLTVVPLIAGSLRALQV